MTLVNGMRGITALAVTLVHAGGCWHGYDAPGLLTRAMRSFTSFCHDRIQLFFVLSGFSIAYSTRRDIKNFAWLGIYLARRLLRLTPPYWASIVLMVTVLFAQARFGHTPVDEFLNVPTVLANLFYVQGVLDHPNINVVYWTLILEVQLYFAFGAAAVLMAWLSPSHRWTAGFYILTAAISMAMPWTPTFLTCWYMFVMGLIAWWCSERTLPQWVGWSAVAALLIWAATIEAPGAPIVTALTGGILLAGGWGNGLYTWLDWRPVQFLGRISYSLFITHAPVIILLLGIRTRLGLEKSEALSFVFFGVVMCLCIAMATAFYHLIEIPSSAWSRRLKPPRRIDHVPAASVTNPANG